MIKELLKINQNSNLQTFSELYDKTRHEIFLSGEFEEPFLQKFASFFPHIEQLRLHNYGKRPSNDFLYQLPNLRELHFVFGTGIIDCSRLSKKLLALGCDLAAGDKLLNLGALSNLVYVYIGSCSSTILGAVGELNSLEVARFDSGTFTSISSLNNLIHLQGLCLGACRKFSQSEKLSGLSSLAFIEFENCQSLRSLDFLSTLPQLSAIELINCRNIESIIKLSLLPNLKQVCLLENTIVKDGNIDFLKSMSVLIGGLGKQYSGNLLAHQNTAGRITFTNVKNAILRKHQLLV
jgi:Leucine-rich repeat (LRR) protein